jgi:predicted nuclease of predicted toxin-antitoxin system
MRFLIGNNRSPLLADKLKAAGHNAAHVRDYGLRARQTRSHSPRRAATTVS